ncbi:D-alanyl-D-alanine carboxypeptidase family protein [Bacillaceae bacterium S4-13-56]
MKKTTIVSSIFFLFIFSCLNRIVLAEEEIEPPYISSESAILIDAKSGQVLYDKYSNNEMYPASTTKIATAIYAIEKGDLMDIVTISKNARGTVGSSVYLDEGEEISLKKLIQGLVINSGNDAAVAIAEHIDGTVEQFSESINKYLKNKVGVSNTHFINPHGLFDPSHTTTASDLAKITQYAMKNETFREIFGIKELEWNGQSWSTTLYTHHKLMREAPYEGVTGGKTGYVNESKFTLVTTAERENISLIVVVLKGSKEGIYDDTVELLDYGFNNFESTVIPKGKEFVTDESEIFVSEDNLYFTQLLDEETKPELMNSGKLVIDQTFDQLDISFHLAKKPVEVEEMNVPQIVKKNEQEDGTRTLSGFFLMIVIVEILAVSILFSLKRFFKRPS